MSRNGARHLDVAIVCMPWASTVFPSLGTGLMVSATRNAGFTARSFYPSLDFSATIGSATYEWMATEMPMFSLGEHLFACDLFGARALDSNRFLRQYGSRNRAVRAAGVTWSHDTLVTLRDHIVPAFLEECVAELVAARPRVIGFSCVFNQALASLALARRVREALPESVIVFGGGLMHGPMGEAYAGAFRGFVDHVFNGEADLSFPQFLRALRDGGDLRAIAGLTVEGTLTGHGEPVSDLDALPIPDFDAFFERRDALVAAGADVAPLERLPFESARGCWWGQKHHCVFCGLNNEGMAFRAKSAPRVIDELLALSRRYQITSFAAADNILVRSGYTTLLPQIAELGLDFRFFYEIKANVSRDEVAAMARAGVATVIPGIESFSDHVLELMRKGSTAAINVQLLKWLAEYGIDGIWNFLVGFHGETDADYEEMLRLLPALRHLPPPSFGGGFSNLVQVHRFAPYHDSPEAFGLRNVRARAFYRHLIPPDVLRGEAYGYFFDHDLPAEAPVHRHQRRLDAELARWQQSTLRRRATLGPGHVRIESIGEPQLPPVVLEGRAALAFVLADAQTSPPKLQAALAELAPNDTIDATALLDHLVAQGVAVRVSHRYVTTIPFARPQTSQSLRDWLTRWSLTPHPSPLTPQGPPPPPASPTPAPPESTPATPTRGRRQSGASPRPG